MHALICAFLTANLSGQCIHTVADVSLLDHQPSAIRMAKWNTRYKAYNLNIISFYQTTAHLLFTAF